MNCSLKEELLYKLNEINSSGKALHGRAERIEQVRNLTSSISEKYGDLVAANLQGLLYHFLISEAADVSDLISALTASASLDALTASREEEDGFDSRYGTVTSLILSPFELPETISVEQAVTSSRCHPSPVTSVNMALDALPTYGIKYSNSVFIDVGSGLGRNLLLASHYPFKKIIGIERSHYLASVSKDNIAVYHNPGVKCRQIEVLCLNALDFSFPMENMVLYFWWPFTEDIAHQFFSRLQRFMQSCPVSVTLVFLNYVFEAVTASCCFRLIDKFTTPDLVRAEKDHFSVSVYSNQ
ncbi:MAG TPA: class I SAM-dependent methyltransferase [Chitinophagaceae bacterium]|nr:class I SAM-dependent methyltransferase [Chitinophagaceae bacterium]